MRKLQRAWFKSRPQRMTALALGCVGLAVAPGVALAQTDAPVQAKPPAAAPAQARPSAERPAQAAPPAQAASRAQAPEEAARSAERPGVVSVTLEEAIARALKVNPQVAQAAGTVTTSAAAERSAFGAYLPTLSANANSSLASTQRLDPTTGAVLTGSSDTYSAGLSAGWDVFTGFQRSATRRQTRAQSNAAEADRMLTSLNDAAE